LQQRIEARLGADLPDTPRQPPDPTVGQIISAAREELIGEALRQLMVQSILALGVMTVASSALGWVIAGRVLRPIARMTEHARRIGETNLHERIDLRGPRDELRELADTFDGLLGRLDAAFDSQRRFVANASHELRTPLSIIRTEVDVALKDPNATPDELRDMAEAIRAAATRSELLMEGLLSLARSDAGVRARRAVDLRWLAEDTISTYGAPPEGVGIELRGRRGPAVVSGDQALLRALLWNLVDNAMRYNRADGWVDVSTGSVDGRSELRVRNSGPPIPAERLDSLFEPFTRMAPQRTSSDRGAGLGLSIVRAVARAHGAELEAQVAGSGGLMFAELEEPRRGLASASSPGRGPTPDRFPGPRVAHAPDDAFWNRRSISTIPTSAIDRTRNPVGGSMS
jgi:signal transduction histidine kinase